MSSEEAAQHAADTSQHVPRLSLQLKRIVTSQNPDRAKKKRKLEEGLDGHGTSAGVKPKNYKKKAQRGKKKKAPPSNPRKEKVRFSEMFRLPFEVLSEIANYLSILDLLSLSRVTRELHYTVLSKNFRRIWRRAHVASGAPRLPSDMNEPQFASLVFDTVCQGCGSSPIRKVDYGFKVRLCSGCSALNLVKGKKLVEDLSDMPKDDPTIFTLCYSQGASQISEVAGRNTPVEEYADATFFSPDFQDVVREYNSYSPDSEERKRFVQHRKKVVNDLQLFAQEVGRWIAGPYSSSKDNFRYFLRRTSILQMLCELDYSMDEIGHSHKSDSWSKLVEQPRELNLLIWRDIFPRLEKVLKERREKIEWSARAGLRGQLFAFFNKFCDAWEKQHGERPLMSFEDLQKWPVLGSFVQGKRLNAQISEEEWKTVLEPELPDRIIAFEKQFRFDWAISLINARHSAGLPRLFVTQPGGPTDLEVVDHAASFIAPISGSYHSGLVNTYAEVVERQRWEALSGCEYEAFRCQSGVIEIASFLLRSLGFPERTTMSEMEGLGEVFVCRCCDRRPALMMGWKNLVSHFRSEKNSFHRLERLLRKNSGVAMDLIDSHNIDVSMQLAERVTPGESEGRVALSALVRKAGSKRCPICVAAFPEETFYSEDSDYIDAHLRSTHGIKDIEYFYSRTESSEHV